MNRQQLRGLIQGTIATIPTPFKDDYSLDLERMAELTQWWIANGLGTPTAPLKVAAAMGEGPDLTDEEWPALLRTVVRAAGSNAVVMCALKPKDTIHTIEDARRAADLGAIGVQIDLPFFHHPNQDDIVRFYTDISDAIDIGILIYNTWWFGAPSLTAQTMLRLKDAEHVVAIKWSVPEGQSYDEMREFAHIFNVIDNDGRMVQCHRNGGRGYISSYIAIHPSFDLTVWKLLEERRYEEAQAMLDRVKSVLGPIGARSSARSGGYRMIKGMMAAIGRPVGPPRPPTLAMDENEIAELQEAFRQIGWLS